MPDNSSSNKRIAKNTLFLYTRMLLLLAISLYASRVILQILGVEDYGTYNVVGGVVVMFSFINGALTTGTQRHLSYELGKNDGNVAKMFSACLRIHLTIGVIIIMLAETLGLWFLNSQMNFPEGRMFDVNVVYQMSILCCFCSIIQTPYNASIIAFERMSFYAYYGIVESILKLGILFLLQLFPFNKLVTYSLLHFVVVLLMLSIIISYVHQRLDGIKLISVRDSSLFRYLFSFSGWTLFGSFAQLMESQGLNIIINIFYGVTINAAVGIANQVRGLLGQFVNGFQQALNPQLVMSQSSGVKDRQFDLIYKSSKFSYFIMLALAFPLVFELNYILQFWLGVVPPYTVQICYLVIFVQLIECLASPLYTTIFAIGNIKNYQIVVCIFRSLSLVIGLLICNLGFAPYSIFIVPCIVALGLLVYRMLFVNKSIGLPIQDFMKYVVLPVTKVTIITMCIMIFFQRFINIELSIFVWILESSIIFFIGLTIIWIFGLNNIEQKTLFELFKHRIYNKVIHNHDKRPI